MLFLPHFNCEHVLGLLFITSYIVTVQWLQIHPPARCSVSHIRASIYCHLIQSEALNMAVGLQAGQEDIQEP